MCPAINFLSTMRAAKGAALRKVPPAGGAAGGEEDNGIAAELDVGLNGSLGIWAERGGDEGVDLHLVVLGQVYREPRHP